jgi:PAS domain S-box-containing protein
MTIQEDEGIFVEYINVVQQRADQLFQATREEEQWQQPQLMLQCLEELRIALEELHVAEEELRQQNADLVAAQHLIDSERQRYQALFQFAPDGYLVTDIYSMVQEANQAAAILLNTTHDAIIGKPLVVFVLEEDRKAFRSMLNQFQQVKRIEEWEVRLRRRHGAPFNAALTVEIGRDFSGEASTLRWLVRDITARKQAEEHLRQMQLQNLQLVETDRLKSQFISTLSHELRTPMQAILGFSQLLQRYFHPQSDPQPLTMLDRIIRNGQNLLSMIEEMLDFSRLEAHRMQLHLEPFDLTELVSTTAEELRSLAEQKGLSLQVNLPQSNIPVVNDCTRVRQILVNLLSNAIKFTEQGRVTLELSDLSETHVMVAVKDTGIGIDPADQEKIFQKFWQVNQSTTRRQGGTGLGLSITYSLVKIMQGEIAVESQSGVGTTIRVKLPRWVNPVENLEEGP